MASTKKNTSRKTTSKPSTSKAKTSGSKAKKTNATSKSNHRQVEQDFSWKTEILLFAMLAFCVVLFVSELSKAGIVGDLLASGFFGLFGVMAYVFPFVLFIVTAFLVANSMHHASRSSAPAIAMKMIAICLLFVFACVFCHLVYSSSLEMSALDAWKEGVTNHKGGGIVGGAIGSILLESFNQIIAFLISIIVMIFSLVLLTQKSLFRGVSHQSRKAASSMQKRNEERRYRRESERELKKERMEEQRRLLAERRAEQARLEEEQRLEAEARRVEAERERQARLEEAEKARQTLEEEEAIRAAARKEALRRSMERVEEGGMDEPDILIAEPVSKKRREMRRARGVSMDTKLTGDPKAYAKDAALAALQAEADDLSSVRESSEERSNVWTGPKEPVIHMPNDGVEEYLPEEDEIYDFDDPYMEHATPEQMEMELLQEEAAIDKPVAEPQPEKAEKATRKTKQSADEVEAGVQGVEKEIQKTTPVVKKAYVRPPYKLLAKGDPSAVGASKQELRDMSARLQSTLDSFDVRAHVTDVTCGPSVTQYEIQLEPGVKVSKITNLQDDIKLALAVADIRIEAPIPGKSAIGIEVPNKDNVTVAFRDLIESKEFKSHPSSIAFCAGKDIAGNVIVADIAKMPHVLIAGATGSGKSVCINTIVMSILYKADPNDVKLIMIDPKVVELSVYNGIPHLLIPVVTDPKKAAGALHWAVAEMTDRYQKFSDYGVRDIKGYNNKIKTIENIEDENKPEKMPQIVVIVDELADLMMVAPGDVEDAICRLAQLARAAGIHLIIATQRPSVNVITGLIKANMPSRIAFSVSSGVDSRTILDSNGAEKLLGKGDMLFYPQGYQKPRRVQGAFVSDREVQDVVDFVIEKNGQGSYNTDIESKVSQQESSIGGGSGFTAANDRDSYFADAGKFIIEKEKGSIGMLQRMFKIGFNRAARIMDQLEEAGVVGPEEGTKPRRVLMTMEDFEQMLSEE